ncbi:hypothetical protein B0O80DRAFT_531037 [Mortierella sp. GBAus27b]|nr:hypothetical protein B0O80DRAFT_531037 [Mortierella sp. GBAus27b]
MRIFLIVVAIRLGIIAVITSYIWLSIQFFKAKQAVSETTPELAMGWLPTAAIVLGSMILPIYLYSLFMNTYARSGRILATPHIVMAFLGIFNYVTAIFNPQGTYRVIGHKDDEDITECIYPTLCPFTTGSIVLGFFIIGGTVADITCYALLEDF